MDHIPHYLLFRRVEHILFVSFQLFPTQVLFSSCEMASKSEMIIKQKIARILRGI